MKKIGLLVLLLFMACGFSADAQSSWTDDQVIAYAKNAQSQGKDQQTIAKELLLKGVTREQLMRIKEKLENGSSSSKNDQRTTSRKRTTTDVVPENEDPRSSRNSRYSDRYDDQNNRRSKRYDDRYDERDNGRNTRNGRYDERYDNRYDNRNNRSNNNRYSNQDEYLYEDEDSEYEYWRDGDMPDSLKVFGRDVFTSKTLTFEPSTQLPTPKNYVLGPGDEVVIDIFGANQTTERQEISADGNINIEILGPVHLSGMTIDKANAYLKDKLSGIYAGLGNDGQSDIMISLGQIRTIQVIVMGEVQTPGTYHLSSLSTAFHALYRAGGVNDNGTLRDIKVVRNGKTISTIDVYKFIVHGDRSSDVVLQEGDVIVVAPYQNIVRIKGNVKRQMQFEMKNGESLSKLIEYSGGFSKGAFRDYISVVQQVGSTMKVSTVNRSDYSTFALTDGDEVTVNKMQTRFENRLEVVGSVYMAGVYALDGKIRSVKTLIEAAGGLLPEAYTTHAVLHRERPNKTLEVLSINLDGIMSGKSADITLRTNDKLFVPSIYDMKDQGYLSISGAVVDPGLFPYADNTTIEDLIIQAGGLLESASLVRVDVDRRISDKTGTKAQSEIAEFYQFKVKDGFVVDGEPGFILKPYDNVIVRKSPSYVEQSYVTISGETNFPGQYVMSSREQRLSELVERAGGVTDFAYVKGARLKRWFTEEEKERLQEIFRSLNNSKNDSLSDNMKNISNTYYVAINLDEALKNKGSYKDLVLRDGDELEIPTYDNTVSIFGAVQLANTVTWVKGAKKDYYIEQAGGFLKEARSRHCFVISMNGNIKRLKSGTEIEPGSEIIVPMKTPGKSNWMQIATTSASMATMLASIYNIIRK